MTDLKTSESLLSALRRAATRTPSAEEIEQQRVSFIMGSLSERSSVTRARVQEVLAQQEGKKARPK
jgi:hypothetical protein